MWPGRAVAAVCLPGNMSIFHKRGAGVQEILFGGGGKNATTPAHNGSQARRASGGSGAAHPASCKTRAPRNAAAPDTKHEVYFVRGRPFIAPSSGHARAADRTTSPMSSATSELHQNELSLRAATEISSGEQKHARKRTAVILTAAHDNAVLSASAPEHMGPNGGLPRQLSRRISSASLSASSPASLASSANVPQSPSPFLRSCSAECREQAMAAAPAGMEARRGSQESADAALHRAHVHVKTSLATANKIAEEEWAALFRNNLLRSCWKPGLSAIQVQHILTQWERRLVEAMHVWLHNDLWLGFKTWNHSTWPRATIFAMRRRLLTRYVGPCFNRWRSTSRIEALGPFLYARLMLGKVRVHPRQSTSDASHRPPTRSHHPYPRHVHAY